MIDKSEDTWPKTERYADQAEVENQAEDLDYYQGGASPRIDSP